MLAIDAQALSFNQLMALIDEQSCSDSAKYQLARTALQGIIAFNTSIRNQASKDPVYSNGYFVYLALMQRFTRKLVCKLVSTKAQSVAFSSYVKRVEGMEAVRGRVKGSYKPYDVSAETDIVSDRERHCRSLNQLVYGKLGYSPVQY
jgi:hypothetical protein